MPNTETVRALINAFNVYNYGRNTVKTNFTLQSRGGKDCIVVSFDKGMNDYQFSEYLYNIKRKIVGEFYGVEEGDTDEVVLNTAKLIFDVKSFPFNDYKGFWSVGEHGGVEFVAPIDQGVIFNLKSHLASSLKKDVLEDMSACRIVTKASNKKDYLWHGEFPNKKSCKEFKRKFLSRMRERYENVPKNPLKIEGNSVYIRDVFDDARFIDSVTRRVAWLVGMYLGVDSSTNHRVKLFKDMIVESIGQSTGVTIYGFVCASPLDRKEASILIPLVDSRRKRILTNEEALELNYAFNYAVFNDLYGRTQGELSLNGSNGIYSIDFSNKEISHCVITKIIESSVINKDHELAINPELHLQALSPAQSPFNSPTHAKPPRTLPNPRKRSRDSGYDSNSPTKPKDSGSSSGGPGPSTELSCMEWESPTRSQDEELGRSANRGSGKEGLLYCHVNPDGPSKGFSPSPQLNSIAVSYGVSGPSSSVQSVSAAQNVQAGTSAWSQPIGFWSSLAPSAEPSLWQPSRPLSWKGASERRTSDKPLTEEEEKLSKALLYWFNLNNYALDPPHTNFIVKNGKIASLIDDSVDVKEYLQGVIDKTKEEYCVNKKEAYDLNEFPFKFLSNCEKNQETTVVANISRGALLNLKELFSQEHEGKVEIKDIDINIVKKAVKSKKDKWVNFQVREHGLFPKAAIETCCPDESALEYISITKGEGGHWIDRNYDASEVKSFREERWPAKGTSKAEKMKSEDNKDSGYSSGFVTDAENVSSKAEATTSGYESMDCENTRGGSPKRKPEKPLEGSPEKSLRRDSSPLSRLESLSLSSSSHQIGKC
ncbi:MAG: hypothetical protein LBP77_03700 [Rickettsiales bacterium]|jgi:hypothetical protein|nr:hypothetical protein [Rickettsiales bacterium]